MKLSVVSKSLRVSLSIYKGEPASEYERAYSLADMLMPQFIECLNAGMPRSEIVTHLMIGAKVKREVATITLCKKLKKIGYVQKATDEDDGDEQIAEIPDSLIKQEKPAKVKTEVSKKVGVKPAENLVAQPALTASQSATSLPASEISAATQSNCAPPERVSLLKPGGLKIGNKFHGIDDVGKKAEQEREIALKAQAGLEAVSKEYGNPIEFLKRQEENKNA